MAVFNGKKRRKSFWLRTFLGFLALVLLAIIAMVMFLIGWPGNSAEATTQTPLRPATVRSVEATVVSESICVLKECRWLPYNGQTVSS